jgi:succinate dehydrogenase / fumarate reductase membrane anchor subunit
MTTNDKSLRSPLGRVRGLGSAKHGTEHWWNLRLTSLALIPLSLYVFATFYINVVQGGHDGAVEWLRSPFAATFVLLFLLFGFHHAANGLQVVIEDYVHNEKAKLTLLLLTKFFAIALALLGSLATIKILFGV